MATITTTMMMTMRIRYSMCRPNSASVEVEYVSMYIIVCVSILRRPCARQLLSQDESASKYAICHAKLTYHIHIFLSECYVN